MKNGTDVKEKKRHANLEDVIEGIGMGPAQIAWGLLGGGIWLADGAELLLVSAVTRSLQKEWHLTAFMKGFIVSAVYMGIFLGNAASGGCSQRFGRREMIVLSYCGIAFCGTISGACDTTTAFMMMRFLGGFFIGIGVQRSPLPTGGSPWLPLRNPSSWWERCTSLFC
eukprot:Skav217973  [mRNA]  locus=scaffold496:27140:34529:- [translate_table: standard]